MIFLAQDIGVGPLQQYFSYIVLGLVMTMGYIAYRIFSNRASRRRDDEYEGLEAELTKAEREIRDLAAQRRQEELSHRDETVEEESGLATTVEVDLSSKEDNARQEDEASPRT